MKKPRSLSELNDLLTNEIGWRVKEIADLKLALKTSDSIIGKSLARACVPILYAHWEGYVKTIANGYLDYLNQLGIPLSDLAECFIVLGTRRKLHELSSSSEFEKQAQLITFFLHELNQKVPLQFPKAINTRSNLDSQVFEYIAVSIGMNTTAFRSRYKLIDERLVGKRNGIAHGDLVRMEKDECRSLADEVIQLLRDFERHLFNLAKTGAYRRTKKASVAAATE